MASTLIDGRFLLEARLDGWGLGECWRAHDRSGGQPGVVVKLLADPAATGGDVATLSERILRLRHPTVAPVLAMGLAGQRMYVAIETTEGESLAHWLDGLRTNGGRADLGTAWSIFEQVCQAVAAGHRIRPPDTVTHGSLGPSNVRIAQRPGGAFDVAVMDFGLAPYAGDGALGARPYALAPERSSLLDEASPAADVYALGVLLAEILATRPRPGTDLPRALQSLATQSGNASAALGPLRGDVHVSVWEALAVALRRAPEERYRDADRLRDALRRATWSPMTEAPDVLSMRRGVSRDEAPPQRTLPPLSPPARAPPPPPALVADAPVPRHGNTFGSGADDGATSMVQVRPGRVRDERPTTVLPAATAWPQDATAEHTMGDMVDGGDPTALVPTLGEYPPEDPREYLGEESPLADLTAPVATTSMLREIASHHGGTLAGAPEAVPDGLPDDGHHAATDAVPDALPDELEPHTRIHVTVPPGTSSVMRAGPQPPGLDAGPFFPLPGSLPPSGVDDPWGSLPGLPPRIHPSPRPWPSASAPTVEGAVNAPATAQGDLRAQLAAVTLVLTALAGVAVAVGLHHGRRTVQPSTVTPPAIVLRAAPPVIVAPPWAPLPRFLPAAPPVRAPAPPELAVLPPMVPSAPPAPAAPVPAPVPATVPHGGHVAAIDPPIDAAITRQDWSTARVLLTAAVGRHPGRADYYARLGDVLWRQGDTAGAMVEYDSAVRLSPRSTAYLHKLATLEEARGDRARALATWQRALAVDPGDATARERVQRAQMR